MRRRRLLLPGSLIAYSLMVSPAFSLLAQEGNATDADVAPMTIEEEWNAMLAQVQLENWKSAGIAAKSLLDRAIQNGPGDTVSARLRYVYLLCSAGEVLNGDLTYDELKARLAAFPGQRIEMPAHPVSADDGECYNKICPVAEMEGVVFTPSTNSDGTAILCFEYVKLRENVDLEPMAGKYHSLAGKIDAIELNPDGSTIWIARVFVSDGTMRSLER